MKQSDYQKALKVVFDALISDEGLYISWKANIAMAFHDHYCRKHVNASSVEMKLIHEISNEAAEYFLSNLLRFEWGRTAEPKVRYPDYVIPNEDSVSILRQEMYRDMKQFADKEESMRRDIAQLQQQIDDIKRKGIRVTVNSLITRYR